MRKKCCCSLKPYLILTMKISYHTDLVSLKSEKTLKKKIIPILMAVNFRFTIWKTNVSNKLALIAYISQLVQK